VRDLYSAEVSEENQGALQGPLPQDRLKESSRAYVLNSRKWHFSTICKFYY